jgi:CheY-like chemotaxis protein
MGVSMSVASGIREKTILVVDDDAAVCELIQEILSPYSYHVLSAQNGLEAVEKTHHHHVDLILLDIRLPYFSGFWFCDAFKHKKNTSNIPIVMISATLDEEKKQKALQMGACAVLQKPFGLNTLLEAVRQYAV